MVETPAGRQVGEVVDERRFGRQLDCGQLADGVEVGDAEGGRSGPGADQRADRATVDHDRGHDVGAGTDRSVVGTGVDPAAGRDLVDHRRHAGGDQRVRPDGLAGQGGHLEDAAA